MRSGDRTRPRSSETFGHEQRGPLVPPSSPPRTPNLSQPVQKGHDPRVRLVVGVEHAHLPHRTNRRHDFGKPAVAAQDGKPHVLGEARVQSAQGQHEAKVRRVVPHTRLVKLEPSPLQGGGQTGRHRVGDAQPVGAAVKDEHDHRRRQAGGED
ncbi:hypothetical protein BU14_2232s0001 [Porphyra umbilicalis]|uniref:Uncharacterized protein n=1 Tax=Porphyra umbilicalis TaxID=2786 RepID=A0A1X6NJZ1_PORUM|nr:hypothetical protein BU14_2232s0001 [Porphyra umbilicalis]|eukprot:OSX68796.1 hypothetical protein BU14_2232s0001 [Porphyra umbilicalis]